MEWLKVRLVAPQRTSKNVINRTQRYKTNSEPSIEKLPYVNKSEIREESCSQSQPSLVMKLWFSIEPGNYSANEAADGKSKGTKRFA